MNKFGDEHGYLPASLPLFPTARGDWPTRDGFVTTIAIMAARLNVDVVDFMGRDTIGEHVWRVSGDRHLASLGLPQPMIMLLARWDS